MDYSDFYSMSPDSSFFQILETGFLAYFFLLDEYREFQDIDIFNSGLMFVDGEPEDQNVIYSSRVANSKIPNKQFQLISIYDIKLVK